LSEQQIISQANLASVGGGVSRSAKEERRAALFRETRFDVCKRVLLGAAWALRPLRLRNLVPLSRLWLADVFGRARNLPDAEAVPADLELAGIARDLSVPTLMEAYRRGFFPHGHVGRAKWMLPETRGVLELKDFRVSSRLRTVMRQSRYRVTFDCNFERVIKACAGRRFGKWPLTWITPRIMHAYAHAFDDGHVHTFEVWNEREELAGGGYGVAVGRVFVIESMFFRESNASKIGFLVLAWHLAQWGFGLCDNKWLTPAMARMRFKEMPRAEYLRRLATLADGTVRPGRWEVVADARAVVGARAPSSPPLAETGFTCPKSLLD
jgi:leucyl/phenylalanyl-tRNA--protein transferase